MRATLPTGFQIILALLCTFVSAGAWGQVDEPEGEGVTFAEVEALVREYLATESRIQRRNTEKTILELEEKGLTAELLVEVFQRGDLGSPDASTFTARGKQGPPDVEWSERRVVVKDLGDAAPDFYQLTLPRDYAPDGDKHYPVVLDLGNGLAGALAGGFGADAVILATIHPDAIPPSNYVYSRQGQSLVLSVLRDLPLRARVDPGRVFLTGGGKRNGDAVFYFAAHYPHLFAGVIPYAGKHDAFKNFRRNAKHLSWLFVSRKPGPATLQNYEFNFDNFERMRKMGADAKFRLLDQDTDQAAFVKTLHEFVRETRREAWPTRVELDLNDDDHSDLYWVSINKVLAAGKPKVLKIVDMFGRVADTRTIHSRWSELKARVAEDRRSIDVETDNVRHLTIELSPALVDWESEIDIRIDGQSRWKERPKPSLRLLLQRFYTSRDVKSLPWARVQILNAHKPPEDE